MHHPGCHTSKIGSLAISKYMHSVHVSYFENIFVAHSMGNNNRTLNVPWLFEQNFENIAPGYS